MKDLLHQLLGAWPTDLSYQSHSGNDSEVTSPKVSHSSQSCPYPMIDDYVNMKFNTFIPLWDTYKGLAHPQNSLKKSVEISDEIA